MAVTRREFLATTSVAAATAWLPRRHLSTDVAVRSAPGLHVPTAHHLREPDLTALAARAIDAARVAGASYADVRLTHTRTGDADEHRAVGVRALVDGIWGYYGSAVWTPDEMARLAMGAVSQARATGSGVLRRPIELGVIPRATGAWTTPIKYDPFDVPIGERQDFLGTVQDALRIYQAESGGTMSAYFRRQHKVFASTEGAAWTQTTYLTNGALEVGYRGQSHLRLGSGLALYPNLFPIAGRGWEYISESGIIDKLPELVEQAERNRRWIPIDLGRYDVVFSGQAMATLLDATLGTATELDRAMGYEANAGGTSYLTDPLGMLGTEQVASPLVTVMANRSAPGGAATVQWDDEGVVPEEFTLVQDGVLHDFQTTRTQAAWLASWYQRQGRPVRSHGCANAQSALHATMQHAPNLALMPGRVRTTFEDLVAGVKKGLAVMSLNVRMDQQQLNGLASGVVYEIKDGKLGPVVRGGTILFRAPQLWKNVIAIGGPGSEQWMGFTRGKGEPAQATTHSVSAVPALIKQVTLIDAERRT